MKAKRKSVFYKLLFCSVAVNLFVILTVAGFYLIYSTKLLKINAKEAVDSSVNLSKHYFDKVYGETIIKDLYFIMSAPYLTEFFLATDGEGEAIKKELTKNLLNIASMSKGLYISLRLMDSAGVERVVVSGKQYMGTDVSLNGDIQKGIGMLYSRLKTGAANSVLFEGPFRNTAGTTFIVGAARHAEFNRFEGALILHVSLNEFFNYFSKLRVFGKPAVWIVDNKNNVLFAPEQKNVAIDDMIITSNAYKISSMDKHLLRVIYGISKSALSLQLKELIIITVFILLMALSLSIGLAYFISMYISKPLLMLAKASRAISEGNFGTVVQINGEDEIGRLAFAFNEMSKRLHNYKKELEYNYYSKNALNTVLELSLKHLSLSELLHDILEVIINLNWLMLKPKGGIYLVDDNQQVLLLSAQVGFSDGHLKKCNTVPIGVCICGKAVASARVIYADCTNPAHKVFMDDVEFHGHYCIPIVFDLKVIGVINLYTNKEHERNPKVEDFLASLANTLAGIIQRKKAEEYLEKFKMMIESANDIIFFKDLESRYIIVNHRAVDFFQLPKEYVIGRDDYEVRLDMGEAERDIDDDKYVFSSGHVKETVRTVVFKNGQRHWFQSIKVPHFGINGKIEGLVGIVRDITNLKKIEEALRENEQRFRKVFEEGPLGICLVNSAYQFLEVNEMLCKITGYPEEELRQLTFTDITHPDDTSIEMALVGKLDMKIVPKIKVDKRYIKKDGSIIWVNYTASAIYDDSGKFMYYIAMIEDITEQKNLMVKLEELAHYDMLSGLPNRSLFYERLHQIRSMSERNMRKFAILYLDLDRFKFINDTYGHDIGDLLIKEVSRRLLTIVRQSDTVARLGGDEFVIILTNMDRNLDAAVAAQKIIKTIAEPFQLKGHECFIGVSIGITVYPDDDINVENLLKNADTAMYHAKSETGSNYKFYSQEMDIAASERVSIENKLHYAMEKDEFKVFYQPIVDLKTFKVVGVEALLRWQVDGKIIEPSRFLYIAEEVGMLIDIGKWVLDNACSDLKYLHDKGYVNLSLLINLPISQLLKGSNFVDIINSALSTYRLNAKDIILELTETLCFKSFEGANLIIEKLSAIGIKLVIDDFGGGRSSLSCLKYLPIEAIKIDRTFLSNIDTDKNSADIVKAIIVMAHTMNLTVIAESVETKPQLDFLNTIDCDNAQGVVFSNPMTIDELERKMHIRNGDIYLL
ncbi:MAG: EAL domain-containing protein [Candidatus Magnetoovum sp. WYHC-5]|nr:EAL domain-containing protein [Candidatus Magnetoovum sp. WYHC-5]